MSDFEFGGKQIIYAHHLTVPTRVINPVPSKSVPSGKKAKNSLDGNLIIHGDNLEALKALLPRYGGRVNCIYIDPPYNTGNEGWAYNDNVNDPRLQEWLKDKSPIDGEDMQRHDKWLCMMWPRLNLLRELLAEDGVIFISIDDNEQHRLRAIMDEIFGENNFVANIIWQKKYAPTNDSTYFSDNHDFVLCYAKVRGSKGTAGWERKLLSRTEKQDKLYKHDDNDGKGPWRTGDLTVKSYMAEYDYVIKNPNTGKEYKPSQGRCWLTNKKTMAKWIKENRVFFGADGKGAPQLKRYLQEVQQGIVPLTIWTYDEVGHTDGARKLLKEIFQDESLPFDNPKSLALLERIFTIAADENAVILDSFAGSGTTAQAVLKMNAEDGGNRKFILVECEDYADTITAERVKRVINGYKGNSQKELLKENLTLSSVVNEKKHRELLDKIHVVEAAGQSKYDSVKKELKKGILTITGESKGSEKVPGLGGTFTYCTLGDDIGTKRIMTGKLPDYELLARHLVYTATGQSPDKIKKTGKDGLFYEDKHSLYYLIYQNNAAFLQSTASALDAEVAERIAKQVKEKKKTATVFASHKFIGQKELTRMGITFCALPYGIQRRQR